MFYYSTKGKPCQVHLPMCHELHMSPGYVHKTMAWVHIDELDGVNAARQSVEAQLEAVPSVEQQVVTMTALLETLDSLWEMPPRKAAAMLQAVRIRVLCEDGQVLRVAFGVAV